MRIAVAFGLAVLLVVNAAAAQSLPKLTQPVHDFAGVIDATTAAELDRRIRALAQATPTHDVVIVVTVKTIAPYGSIEEYAVRLFEQAGIGQKKLDNGVLILLAHGERQVRIELGYDIEQFISDGYAGDTIRQQMLPAFRKGDFGGGLLAGATHIINKIAASRGVTLSNVPATAVQADHVTAPGWITFLPIALILLFVIIGMIRSGGPTSRGRRGPWGGWGGPFGGGFGGGLGGFGGGGFGGGGGGGFGGFGGGMSGGGGASGRW